MFSSHTSCLMCSGTLTCTTGFVHSLAGSTVGVRLEGADANTRFASWSTSGSLGVAGATAGSEAVAAGA
eukprot:scaffold123396_cov30-Tisochrysis_lutea.AAC.9